jgi:hypothetical protein
MAVKKSPGKSSATKTKKIKVILKIRSLDPGVPPQVAAEKVAESAPALSKHLKAKFGIVRVQVDRRKTFPVDPVTILVTVAIFVGTRVAGKAVDKVIDATVSWAKRKFKRAHITKGDPPPNAPSSKTDKGQK